MAIPHAGAGPPPDRRLSFHGDGRTLLGIYIVNIFLTLVTLGIYYAWGKTRVRKYMLAQIEFERDRFAWHGTGKELLIGYLKVGALLLILSAASWLVRFLWRGPFTEPVLTLSGYVVALVLVPIGMVGARRYRFSRISWRGIRFSFRGRAKQFMRIFIGGTLLSVITLGLYYPIFQNNVRRYLVGNTYFGTVPFGYEGHGRDLFRRFMLMVGLAVLTLAILWPILLMIAYGIGTASFSRLRTFAAAVLVFMPVFLVLGVDWLWYAAWRQRYYWTHTSFSTARFRSSVTALRLISLTVTNLLLVVVTLGVALPWVLIRTIRFGFANVALEGPLDLDAIQQDAQAASATGEALGQFLEIGALDFDLPF